MPNLYVEWEKIEEKKYQTIVIDCMNKIYRVTLFGKSYFYFNRSDCLFLISLLFWLALFIYMHQCVLSFQHWLYDLSNIFFELKIGLSSEQSRIFHLFFYIIPNLKLTRKKMLKIYVHIFDNINKIDWHLKWISHWIFIIHRWSVVNLMIWFQWTQSIHLFVRFIELVHNEIHGHPFIPINKNKSHFSRTDNSSINGYLFPETSDVADLFLSYSSLFPLLFSFFIIS